MDHVNILFIILEQSTEFRSSVYLFSDFPKAFDSTNTVSAMLHAEMDFGETKNYYRNDIYQRKMSRAARK